MALNEGAVDWSVNWSIDRLVKRSVGRGGVGERATAVGVARRALSLF